MAETVALAFAAVEFGCTVLHHYSKVKQGISKYREYEKEAHRIAQLIAVRQSRYRNALVQLIAPYTGLQDALQMVQDTDHDVWTTVDFHNYLRDSLGSSRDAFVGSIDLIRSDLEDIEKIGEDCGLLSINMSKSTKKSAKAPDRVSVNQRIKYVLSQKEIKETLSSLKEDTDDFCELVNTLCPLREGTPVITPTIATRRKIQRNSVIRAAASALYQALSHACTKHATHQVLLNLIAHCANLSQVKFNINLTHLNPNKDLPPNTVACHQLHQDLTLLVETSSLSAISLHTATSDLVSDLVTNVQSSLEYPFASTSINPAGSEKPKSPDGPGLTNTRGVEPEAAVTVSQPQIVAIEHDLCTDLHRHALQMKHHTAAYADLVLHLPTYGDHKHTMQLAPAAFEDATEISKLFNAVSSVTSPVEPPNASTKLVSRRHKMALARMLSQALLQYYETPWLDDSWTTDHILVTGISVSSPSKANIDTVKNLESYVKVSMRSPQSNLPTASSLQAERSFVRNHSLFRLGVMLLEMGCDRSLNSSISSKDEDPYNNENTEYNAALRIRRKMVGKLGSEYGEIIRKCIECDFGHGADLNVASLQEAFYENVVKKLESLEKSLDI